MDNDFKYVIQDFDAVYIGSKYSFDEIIQGEDFPPKLRGIIERYLAEGLDPSTTIESQLYFLTPESREYSTYRRLKARVKFTQKKRGDDTRFAAKNMKVVKFAEIPVERKKELGIVIRELEISKIGLMTFT